MILDNFMNNFTLEESKIVKFKIYMLPTIDQKAIFAKWGENLDENNSIDTATNKRARKAVNKLKRILRDPSYTPSMPTEHQAKENPDKKHGPVKVTYLKPEKAGELKNKSSKKYEKKALVRSLKEALDCTDEELEIIILNIKNSQVYVTFAKVYGKDLLGIGSTESLTDSEKNSYNSYLSKVRKSIKEGTLKISKERKNGYIFRSLKEALDCTDEELKLAIKKIKASKNCDLLTRVYGENLLEAGSTEYLTENERITYDAYMSYIRNDIKNKTIVKENSKRNGKANRTLKEVLDCTDEELIYAQEYIKSSKVYRTFVKIFGSDLNQNGNLEGLTPEEKIQYFNKTSYLKRTIKEMNIQTEETLEEPELLTSVEYETIPTNFNHPIFKEALKIIPIEYRYVVSLHLGIYDGNAYPIKALCEIFNFDEKTIQHKIDMGLAFFREIMASYEKIYGKDFPNKYLESEEQKLTLIK